MGIGISIGSGGGGAGGGVIYVPAIPGLPNPADATRGATYGREDGINTVSLWRVTTRPAGTVATFADSRGRYKGDHNSNPASPTNVGDYYLNDNFEHARVSNGGGNAWQNLPSGVNTSLNDYLPADNVWIDGDGSVGGEGFYDNDQEAFDYLATTVVDDSETYVFFNRSEDEARTVAGLEFFGTAPRWEAVSAGDGPVPGGPGRNGTDGDNYDPAEVEALRDETQAARDDAQAARGTALGAAATATAASQISQNAQQATTNDVVAADNSRVLAQNAQEAAQGAQVAVATIGQEAGTARDESRTARDESVEARAGAEAARDAAQAVGGHLEAIQGYIEAGTQTNATLVLTDAGELNLNVTGGGTPIASDHTRVAVISPDNTFSNAEITGDDTSSTSMVTQITLPQWADGTRYLLFLQPLDEAVYTDMRPQNGPFNRRGAFDVQTDSVSYNGTDHRAYLYDSQLLQAASGEIWELM